MPFKLGLLIFAIVCVAIVEYFWCIRAKILPRVTAKREDLLVDELHTLLGCKSWLASTDVNLWNAFSILLLKRLASWHLSGTSGGTNFCEVCCLTCSRTMLLWGSIAAASVAMSAADAIHRKVSCRN